MNIRSTLCLSPADWKYRHAGLMALSAIGEGCHQQMEAILQEIVSFVLLFCDDQVRNTSSELINCYKDYKEDWIVLQVSCTKQLPYCIVIKFGFFFPPQHPRVRYAACNAIGQMATDFAPTFQKKFHDKVT